MKVLLLITVITCCLWETGCVYNGKTVRIYKHPWVGILEEQDTGRYRGNVVLIDEFKGLAAAHDIQNGRPLRAIFGHDGQSGRHNRFEIQTPVLRSQRYPNYREINYRHDIAVLHFDPSVPTENNLTIQRMPRLATVEDMEYVMSRKSKTCLVVGNGVMQNPDSGWDNPDSTYLQELETKVISRQNCSILMAGRNHRESVCSFNDVGGPCGRDGGAPLMCRLNGTWTLMGIYSRGGPAHNGCNKAQSYSGIPWYRDWIRVVTGV